MINATEVPVSVSLIADDATRLHQDDTAMHHESAAGSTSLRSKAVLAHRRGRRGWWSRLAAVFACALILAPGLRASDASTQADAFVARYATEHSYSGAILVQKDGRIAYAGNFGLANRSFGIRNGATTRYRIASITKLFTSVLILQLHDQGRLALDKTISRYLPDYSGDGGDKVSIHQLLNHTSGLPNFDTVTDADTAIHKGLPAYQTPRTSAQLLKDFCSGNLVRAPGTVFEYNNADYIVLGQIIERLYGASYDAVLKAQILDPLKLHATGMLHQPDIVPNLADTYFYREDLAALANDLPAYPENWYAAGAMYSTPMDLLEFSNALFAGKLIKASSLALLLTPGLDDYGYGAWVYETMIDGKPHRVMKRPGQIMGAQAQLYRFVDSDLTVILLANTSSVDMDEFVAAIGKQYMKQQ